MPAVKKGIKLIFVGEIFAIISAFFYLLHSIFVIAGGNDGFLVALNLIAYVLVPVSFILILIGLIISRNADENYKYSMYCAIAAIVLAIAYVALGLTIGGVVTSAISAMRGVATIAMVIFCILGLMKVPGGEAATKGKIILIVYSVLLGISMIIGTLPTFIGAFDLKTVYIFIIISSLFDIAASISFAYLLKIANK